MKNKRPKNTRNDNRYINDITYMLYFFLSISQNS